MFKSYLASALRNLVARKLYASINILGLAIGLASVLLIALYVRYETSYDGFWSSAGRIYRISRDYAAVGGAPARLPASNNAPTAPALLAEFPEVEQVARVFGGNALLRRDDLAAYEDRVRFTDPSILAIFDFGWIEGDARTALAKPNVIVLTQRLATKYFGAASPLGKTLTFENRQELEVTGVIRDLPDNTHLSLDALVSLDTVVAMYGSRVVEQRNGFTDFHTYFLLRDGASVAAIRARIPDFVQSKIADPGMEPSGMTIMDVRDIHTRSTRDEEWKPVGSAAAIYGFTAIAALILLVACINFTNLSTALATKRAREVGVRKSLGAARSQVVAQFLGESVLTAALAMLVAAMLVELALPAFDALVGAKLGFRYFGADGVVPFLAALTLVVGLISGTYPAFYLSAFDPARVLKGEVTGGAGGAAFRNALVIAQFAVATALLIGTAVVYRQTTFARHLELGFDKDQVVVLAGSPAAGLGPQWPALKQRLLDDPTILGVTASHYSPFTWDDNRILVRAQGDTSTSRIQYMVVDYDFFSTYRIDVLSGRAFSKDHASDAPSAPTQANPVGAGGFIVNEAAAKQLGRTSDAGGVPVEIGLDPEFRAKVVGEIVGVVRDTFFESVQETLRPMIFVLGPDGASFLNRVDTAAVRIDGRDVTRALAHVDAVWRELVPDLPVARHFLDEDFDALYRSEERQGRLFAIFAGLAVFIACLGLFGLASLTTARRTKEIGIRKALGGTVWDLVSLLTSGFGKLVLLANVVAWPVAYFVMQRWLSGFAYRAQISPWLYVGSAALALLIACLTVGAVAARAAAAKPIQSLRYE